MTRNLRSLVLAAALVTGPAAAQSAEWPATPQGRLAAGFFTAVNAPDDETLLRFQEANFSEAALKRRTPDERAALGRQLREQAGTLSLAEVRSSSPTQLVIAARGANLPPGMLLTVTFTFTAGASPRIDTVQIAN